MNSSSWYGLGRCHMIKSNFKAAIEALEETTKQSIALQPIYWAARRVKALAHLELKEFEKPFLSINFSPPDNFQRKTLILNIWLWLGLTLVKPILH